MRPYRTERWITVATKKLNTKLSRHAQGEACGPCPRCGGKDRFIVFMAGNAWCRRCNHKAWWIDNPEEGRRRIAEEKIQQEQDQIALRRRMAVCQDWTEYHTRLLRGPELLDVWGEQGMGPDEIRKWGLGCCPSCPTAPDYASLTIPCFQEGALLDIRHRLINAPPEEGKYRSHLPGLIPPIFNLDAIKMSSDIIIVEGEKKAIIMDGAGFTGTVGLPGINFAKYLLRALPGRMNSNQRAIVMLDPHTNSRGEKLAEALGGVGVEAVVADCFQKPDDMIIAYGVEPIKEIIRQARTA